MVELAIGIVTYNTKESELEMWLHSLKQAKNYSESKGLDLNIKLIYIDNGNKSQALSAYENVTRLDSRGNIGFTVASNLIVEEMLSNTGAEYYLTGNPDGMFHPYFFYEIITFAKGKPLAIVECSQFPEEHPKMYDKETFEVSWASGCASLYPREILNKVGSLDENFFMYCEDVDFSWRTKLAGYKVLHCPNALYAHFVINRKATKTTTKFFYESGRYLGKKYHNAEFVDFCEEVLVAEGIYSTYEELPQIEVNGLPASKEQAIDVSNFVEKFYFSRGRWS
ncbi:glycosyltransferase family 2 protein [Vibrio maerlii]|uniref:glycosyltransferase family 2 protein n=1 Tax=Vibrio maerlii TaxID=2231648 RepID=UPI000E3D88CD|nr:hypothetical protein [Vibrio maerlii]